MMRVERRLDVGGGERRAAVEGDAVAQLERQGGRRRTRPTLGEAGHHVEVLVQLGERAVDVAPAPATAWNWVAFHGNIWLTSLVMPTTSVPPAAARRADGGAAAARATQSGKQRSATRPLLAGWLSALASFT